MRIRSAVLVFAVAALLTGCSGGGGNGSNPPPANVMVTVSPATANVRAGQSQQFTATVTGTTNTFVTWSVNGTAGGNSTLGTIGATGLYTAPASLPTPNSVTIQAASAASATASGTSAVTLLNSLPVLNLAWPGNLGMGSFSLLLRGAGFVPGVTVTIGGRAVATPIVTSTELVVTGAADAAWVGDQQVTVRNPDPGAANSSPQTVRFHGTRVVSAAAAARFLEQSTFGPSEPWIDYIRYIGFENFLVDQFNAPPSTFPETTQDAPDELQFRFWANALNNPDQLRQRTAFALHKIWVVSWVVVESPQAWLYYLRMHMDHPFTNYRTIMENVTLNPAMGQYQDVANNDKPDPARGISANENYGRELMQLFTIGIWKMNQNGTLKLDDSGNPSPTYDQTVVEGNARAITGWTYPTQPGATLRWTNPPYYIGKLEPVQSHHDTDAGKQLLDGFVLAAGGTAQEDLRLTLDNLFQNPNVPPHVSKLLIQQFVTSNPSPAYVSRVTDAFISGRFGIFGGGQRGDMKATIAAILLDPEARRGDSLPVNDPAVADDGKLREPVLYVLGLLRGLRAQTSTNRWTNDARNMGQFLFFPPTVFSYFSPDYQLPGTNLLGPELQLQTTATALIRANWVNTLAFGNLGTGNVVDYNIWVSLAENPDAPDQLLDRFNNLFLAGRMTPQMRASILNALNAVPSGSSRNLTRVRTAVYLIAASSQYQVQH